MTATINEEFDMIFIDFNAEDTMNDKLEEISDELDHALKRRHGKT